MSKWKEYKLGDVTTSIKDRINTSELDVKSYISTENMLPDKAGITFSSGVPLGNAIKFLCGDILISNIRPYFKKIWKATFDGGCSADVICFRASDKVTSDYLYYLLSQDSFFDYVMKGSKGTKMPRGDRKHIDNWTIYLPSTDIQKQITSVLKSLDDKIESNRKINENLEQQAQALFKSWFIDFEPFKDNKFIDSELGPIPEGWKVMSLSDIANYLNGLAMQKYRPNNGEKGLPVLKIKELGAGQCDSNSDLCSSSINEDYIVNDGDVIFSWSGTLLVDIWCGGKCGLNQHLFKVTSSKYPKWFYYLWTLHHLSRFINIAKDKAVTMGHIKRGELDTSLVCIPPENEMENATSLIEPYIKNIISIRVENRKLASLRDALLPKLMSGEIEV